MGKDIACAEISSVERLQLWTKFSGYFCISGAFSNSHRPNPSPPLTPQTKLDACIQNFVCIGWGEGELQENFEKAALLYEGTQK